MKKNDLSQKLGSAEWVNTSLKFLEDTEINEVVDFIDNKVEERITEQDIDVSELENESNEQYIDVVDDIISENTEVSEFISKLGITLSQEYSKSLALLKSKIAPEVTNIVSSIETRTNDYIEMVFKRALESVSNETPDFNIVDFTQYDYSNNPRILNLLKSINLSSCEEMTAPIFRNIVRRAEVFQMSGIDVKKVDFTVYAKETIQSMYPNNEDYQNKYLNVVETALIGLNNPYHDSLNEMFTQFYDYNVLTHNNRLTGSSFGAALRYINVYKVFENIPKQKIMDDVSEETFSILTQNLQILDKLYTVCLLICNQMKYMNDGILILNNQMVNKQELDLFEENGGTKEDIFKYLRLKFNNDENDAFYGQLDGENMPMHGISTITILAGLDTLHKEYDLVLSRINQKSKEVQDKAVTESIHYELKAYANRHGDKNNRIDFNNKLDRINRSINMFMSNEDMSLEDMVYDYVLGSFYKDSLTESVHKSISMETFKMFNTNGAEITNETTDVIMLKAFSNIATQFINKQFVKF